ncbi:MAG: ATP-binding protein, partial [Candidatus Falkowbacteria bacterium]|nr:ATP-binding protein [Candidatus Falkowbacteria bacterium]
DKDHLKRALINLFDNSFKFTREGDKISLRISRMIEGNRISFSLTDTGQGMAPDDILNIWKPFVQGKGGKKQYRSTGLGLSIVKSTIERLGGSIAVESELGKGSTFIIVIPEKIESEE